MSDLISSGRFAQRTHLTRKALRLYADLGLLLPVHVDERTGYRWYSPAQLQEAGRITLLRALDMPLDEIHGALRVWHGPGLQDRLLHHRQVLTARLEKTHWALAELDRLLGQVETPYTVRETQLAPLTCLTQRRPCAPEDACAWIVRAEHNLRQTVQQQHLRTAGACLAVYHDAPGDDQWDVEVCLPYSEDRQFILPDADTSGDSGTVTCRRVLPGGPGLSTVHAGEYGPVFGSMQEAYGALSGHAARQGLTLGDAPREVYLLDQRHVASPADYRTEIIWPLAGQRGAAMS